MASLPVKIATAVDADKLAVGEIVVNSTNGEVWTKTSAGEVKKVGAGSDAYLLNRANHTGTQPMASIGDKQGKVLDDLTPLLVTDLDLAVEPKGYLLSDPDGFFLGGFLDGAQLFVQQTQEGLLLQTIHAPLLGNSLFRTKPVGGAWSDITSTISQFDIIDWHGATTYDPPNTVINPDGTFSRSLVSHNQNPLLEVSGASRTFIRADVNKYARYIAAGAKTATFDSSEGFTADDTFHITNRATSGNITISGTGVTFNAPKGGTLVLEPGDTVTVKFISPTEADVIGSVEAGEVANLPTDDDFDNVSALLHFNGSQGSTTITDSSKLGQAITTSGSIFIDQTQSVFGGASLRCGAGKATIPSIELGSGDFTVEFRIHINALPTAQVGVIGNSIASGNYWFISLNAAGTLAFSTSTGGSTYPTPNLSAGVWYHIAFVRLGGVLYSYLNGIKQNQTATSTSDMSSNPTFIGAYDNSANRLDGWIDELRITPKIARYTKNFTVPNKEYPNAAP